MLPLRPIVAMGESPHDGPMLQSDYSASETLRDGRRVEIRALRATDRADLMEAFGRMSDQSRYLRFFAPKRALTDKEIAYFTDVDFVNHVALVVVLEEADRRLIVGGGRYIVTQPGCAEIAFGVDDEHQGVGIASLLLQHLIAIARTAGLKELHAEVLSQNTPMLKTFARCGLAVTTARASGTAHVSLHLQ
jgi:GNAT superfamily N-acetyltransferase